MKKTTSIFSVWIFLFVLGHYECVNVHFENKDGGFFIKQQSRHFSPLSPSVLDSSSPTETDGADSSGGIPLSVDRFTVFQSSQPISVRATYGPFSTKQTVPARYIVPDPLPLNTSGPAIDLQDQATHHLDMSAHIVRNDVPRDSPVLRVLFHTGTDPGGRRQVLLARHHQRVCIVLHATMGTNTPLHAACSPDGEDGVCLAQVTIPTSWWPPLPTPDKDGRPGKFLKSPPRVVQVAYSVLEPWPDEGEGCHPKMQVQPSVILGTVPLVPAKGAYKELRLADSITMLVPHPPLFPLSRLHVPVFVDRQKGKLLTAIVVRARVKSGVRLLDAVPSATSTWNITVDINPRHVAATITLVRREPPDTESVVSVGEVTELFTWLLEITEDATEQYDGARIVWSARFEPHQEDSETLETHRGEGKKTTTRFEIQKDDIQAVVPISKNWEVLNTAVLTGQQVSQAMKVFIVSQAGKAADVTYQASCHSDDESVLKVSSSCGSVYVDGSEARGSINGSVLVKYGSYTGLAQFTVWMPEFPLELAVADTRLSQLKSWRVPDYHQSVSKSRRKKRSYSSKSWSVSASEDNGISPPVCRLRYQQTSVDVFAHFFATDHESGRTTYLINRRTWLRVTDLVLPWLRVSDPRIASLHGRILQGRSVGRTEVQVLSPITSRVYGSKEIRVGNDKVALTKLSVQVVSGLQLNISPDSSLENVYVAETGITRKLTAQYQEGLLDIELEFSDDTKTPLRDISDTDYHLVVESLDPEVVAFAPMVASHHPRVIAVGEGNGDLLQVTLLLAEECRNSGRGKIKSSGALATAAASISVDFSTSDLSHRPDILQNDGGSYAGSKFSDLSDILRGNSFKDDKSQEPNVQARQFQGNSKGVPKIRNSHNSTPLEISMYVLLAAFCCAIVISYKSVLILPQYGCVFLFALFANVFICYQDCHWRVFVISCVVYASKFKPIEAGVTAGVRASPVNPSNLVIHREPRKPRESTTNAHDWVWLGRATIDTSNRNSAVTNNNPSDMRIITNPLNMNYCEPDDALALASSFDNPTHIELPSIGFKNLEAEIKPNREIDSSTYCRNKVSGEKVRDPTANSEELQVWNKPTPPPPLPPHGISLQIPAVKPKQQDSNNEYRPPVPPHRNITYLPGSSSSSEGPPVRKFHNHRRNKSQEKINHHRVHEEIKPTIQENAITKEATNEATTQAMFEFENEPPTNKRSENIEFVEYPESSNARSNRNSAEVKRATVVGNPMFSTNATDLENKSAADLAALDDLQLDMDYDQIMHYFDNLKESNA